MSMLDILSMLDGWEYVFPYFEENIPIRNKEYKTLYNTAKNYPTGGIIYANIIMDTPNFHVKISTGNLDLHEINVLGILYGQAPAGFDVPAGLVANVYIPIAETIIDYPISVADPAFSPVTGITLMNTNLFPYKNGIELKVKVDNPPATIYENSIGIVNIYDKVAYLKSLNYVYGNNPSNPEYQKLFALANQKVK